MKLRMFLFAGLALMAARSVSASPLGVPEFVPSPLSGVGAKIPINNVWCDRVVYAPNDPPAQVLVVSSTMNQAPEGAKLVIGLEDAAGKLITAREIVKTGTESGFLVKVPMDVSGLAPGAYSLRGTVHVPGASTPSPLVQGSFSVRTESRETFEFPNDGVPLVTASTGIPGETVAPISFGAPLPYGAVGHQESLIVLEDGKPITTQSQPLAFWGPGPEASVRWMGISFQAKYQDGKPREYRLVKGRTKDPHPVVEVHDRGEQISVNTGPLKFSLSKKAFRGPENLQLQVGETFVTLQVPASAGGYVVDQHGIRYEAAADRKVEVRVEETGPARAAISFRGWYVNPLKPSERLCQFWIRIYAYAGSSRLDVTQRTIVTYDTRKQKLADVGFSMPAVGAAAASRSGLVSKATQFLGLRSSGAERGSLTWLAGVDGEIKEGAFPAKDDVFFTQARADAVWLNQLDGDPVGRRSDGWLAVRGETLTATGFLRDVWQKFPKEISSDGRGMTFHTWPKHSAPVFSPEEQITRENIHRSLFAHQGPLLDLQLPQSYFDQLQAWHKEESWDRENTAAIGFRSTADGVSMSSRFGIEYSAGQPAPSRIAAQAAVGVMAPSALTNPAWNVASGVIPFINAAGDPRWQMADAAIESYVRGMNNLAEAGNIHGMWIYGNSNNNWDTTLKVPLLHRVWQNSHYGHVSFPWKYYFRSADPQFLNFARAQTGNLMDVGIVYYGLPEVSSQYAGKAVGALYHAKGWLPWGVRLRTEFRTDSDLGLMQHWTNPKAFLERSLIDMDLEARDTFHVWLEALYSRYQYRPKYGVGRELTQSLSEMVDIYQTLWDPRLVGYLRPMGDSALAVPFNKYLNALGFALFNRTWPIRYYDFARDPRVLERLREALPGESYGPYGMAASAFLLDQDKDLKRLPRLYGSAKNYGRSIYRNPEDPLDAFAGYASAVNTRSTDEIPSVLYALSRVEPQALEEAAKKTEPVDSFYSARATRARIVEGQEAAQIFALNPDGRGFRVRFESRGGIDMLPAVARVVAPGGEVIQTIPLHEKEPGMDKRPLRYLGAGAKVVEIPAGAPGVYRVDLYGHFPIYKATLTDLPEEIAMLKQASSSVDGYVFSPGAESLVFRFNVNTPQGSASPTLSEVRNLVTGETQSQSLLYGSLRTGWQVPVKGGPEGVRARILGPSVSWDPVDHPVFFAVKESAFEPVLRALPARPASAKPSNGDTPTLGNPVETSESAGD